MNRIRSINEVYQNVDRISETIRKTGISRTSIQNGQNKRNQQDIRLRMEEEDNYRLD